MDGERKKEGEGDYKSIKIFLYFYDILYHAIVSIVLYLH